MINNIKDKFALEIDSGANFIIEKLEKNGFEGFIVGGCVRDSIMGRKPNDWDITTNALPKDLIEIFERTIPTGIEHGTVTVMIGEEAYEVTTYRVDGEYVDMRHPEKVNFSKNIGDDLSRRDFTINAMAYNEKRGIVDAFNGIEDIENKIIRCVGNPDIRFNEDALRIIRAIRFSAKLGFEISDDTYKSMEKNIENLKLVSKERINKELEEIIEYNALKIKIFNDTGLSEWLFGKKLIESDLCDSYSIKSLSDSVEDELHMQTCKRALSFKSISEKDLKAIMKNLRYSKKDIDFTSKTHKVINDIKYKALTEEKVNIEEKRVLIKCLLGEIGNNNLAKYAIYSIFIEKKRNPTICFKLFNDIIDLGECFSVSKLGLNGKDIIENNIAKGAQIGEILEALLDHVIKNPLDNEKDILLALAKNYKKM